MLSHGARCLLRPVDQGPENVSVENLKRDDLHGTQGYPCKILPIVTASHVVPHELGCSLKASKTFSVLSLSLTVDRSV